MASLRRFDVQARYSLMASAASVLPLLAACIAIMTRWDTQLSAIKFGDKGMFRLAFFACIAATMGLSVLGIILGFNSAGQRRNHDQKKSWMGFFIGTAVLSLALIVFVAFRMLKLKIAVGGG